MKVSFSSSADKWVSELKRVLGEAYLRQCEDKDKKIMENYNKADPRQFFVIETNYKPTAEEVIIKGVRELAEFYQADNFLNYATALERDNLLLAESFLHVHNQERDMTWICGHGHSN
jgi:hypothetical protein